MVLTLVRSELVTVSRSQITQEEKIYYSLFALFLLSCIINISHISVKKSQFFHLFQKRPVNPPASWLFYLQVVDQAPPAGLP